MKLKFIYSFILISAISLISFPIIGAVNCQCEIPRLGGNERDVYQYEVKTPDCCTGTVTTTGGVHEVQVFNEGVWQITDVYYMAPQAAQDKCCTTS